MLLRDHPDPPDLHPRVEWLRLAAGRRARLTGRAGGLTGAPLHVFTVCAEHANPRDGSNMRASLVGIAGELGMNVKTVRDAMRRLESDYWIRCKRRSKGGIRADGVPNPTSTYRVLTLPDRPGPTLTATQRRQHWSAHRRAGYQVGRVSDPTRRGAGVRPDK